MSYPGLRYMLEQSGFSTQFIDDIEKRIEKDPLKYLDILKEIDEKNPSGFNDDLYDDRMPKRN